MKRVKHLSDDVYSQLLEELSQLQIQINTAKPDNLKALLDRQLTIHERITNRLTILAEAKLISPRDAFQSIVRPPYVVTFLLQNNASEYCITVHAVSYSCQF